MAAAQRTVSGYGSAIEVQNSIIRKNTGDGINTNYSDLTVVRCMIEDNGGDGIENSSYTSPIVENSIIRHNKYHGITCNGILESEFTNNWLVDNGQFPIGGGIYITNSSSMPLIRNNTIAGNCQYGIKLYGSGVEPNIMNCIVWGNGSQASDNLNGTFNCITYSCIGGGHTGTGNISSDPCFMNTSDANNYHLTDNSLCIDAGNPNDNYDGQTDIDGEERVMYDNVDMGADEFYRSLADYNKDGTVNFADFVLFAESWQVVDGNISLDDDNNVNSYDLLLFCNEWLWRAGWLNDFDSGMGVYFAEGGVDGGEIMMELETGQEFMLESVAFEVEQVIDVNELVNWLDELWETDKEIRDSTSEKEWQEFIETVKSLEQY